MISALTNDLNNPHWSRFSRLEKMMKSLKQQDAYQVIYYDNIDSQRWAVQKPELKWPLEDKLQDVKESLCDDASFLSPQNLKDNIDFIRKCNREREDWFCGKCDIENILNDEETYELD
jgi:hypothetical protein